MPKKIILRTKDTKATCTGRLDDTVILFSGIVVWTKNRCHSIYNMRLIYNL